MLHFALEYRPAIEKFTADRKNGLRQYELTETEWETARQLDKVLKVSALLEELYMYTHKGKQMLMATL